ncbi:MAG: SGNH/GDSL hydrolase family protein [Roseburia sp.]|nr:SGNH/GDSL hydrolase family protein [Roseburia sp.]
MKYIEKNSRNKKSRILLPLLCMGALAVLIGHYINIRPSRETRADIQRLSTESYHAFFTSMYPIHDYDPQDFITYRGIQTLKLDAEFSDLHALKDYFDTAFASPNDIEVIYLGLDPAALWDACLHQEKLWKRQLAYLLERMTSHADTTFEIMLPYPSLSYWTSLSKEDLDETLTLYQALGDAVSQRSNALVHFIGAEEWLIANPGNYLEEFSSVNPKLTHKLMLLNFCDRDYLMTGNALSQKLADLRALAEAEKSSPTVYADLSDWYFVFLGDSVMAYDTGSSSIPGVVCGLSGADAANLSQGGSPATADPAAMISLERMIDALEKRNPEAYEEVSDFHEGLEKYLSDWEDSSLENRRLCFVICLGLNDYFGAHPVDNPAAPDSAKSYGGALRNGVRRLKKLAPDAGILIMAPSYTDAFSGGTEIAGVDGGILTDYVETALAVSREMQVECANIYADSGINAQTHSLYLADGVHPNEDGRFLLGKFLVDFWGGIVHEE